MKAANEEGEIEKERGRRERKGKERGESIGRLVVGRDEARGIPVQRKETNRQQSVAQHIS